MQREEDGYIIISCDFCGTDWDEVIPMIEGHRGSVMCLDCLKRAMDDAAPGGEEFTCTMCLQTFPGTVRHWSHPSPAPSPGLNPGAVICWSDIRQAAKAFHKDKEVDFRWDPAQYPVER